MENQTEFDLNCEIADWRQQMSQSPAYRSENLEELEAHLRDSVANLGRQGLSEEEAFLIATRRVGPARALEPEFAKVNGKEVWLGRLLWMLVGVQAWSLVGSLSTLFTRVGAHLLIAQIPGLGRWLAPSGQAFQTGSGAWVSVSSPALFFVADIVPLTAMLVGCWWLIRRTESRLRRLLQRPGWIGLGVGGLCLALLLGFTLNLLGQAWSARSLGPSDYGKLSYAMSMAGLPLFVVKTTALAVLTVLLARRQLRRTAT